MGFGVWSSACWAPETKSLGFRIRGNRFVFGGSDNRSRNAGMDRGPQATAPLAAGRIATVNCGELPCAGPQVPAGGRPAPLIGGIAYTVFGVFAAKALKTSPKQGSWHGHIPFFGSLAVYNGIGPGRVQIPLGKPRPVSIPWLMGTHRPLYFLDDLVMRGRSRKHQTAAAADQLAVSLTYSP